MPLSPERWDKVEDLMEKMWREKREAERFQEMEPGRWGDHASPVRMRRDRERDREEDEQ